MKIIFITTSCATLQAFLLPFAKYFSGMGWHIDAMAAGGSECICCRESFEHVFEIKWTRNPFHIRNLFHAPRQIKSVIRNGDYDIVHVHTPIAAFVTRWALRSGKSRRPTVIYTAHGFHFFRGGGIVKNLVFRALEKLAGRWTDYLVVINHEDAEAARRYGIVPANRIVFMPGIGVDTTVYNPENVSDQDVAAVRSELGLLPGDLLLSMIAEFNPGKRHCDAIRAFAMLADKNAHLAFAGDGPLRKSMTSLAQALGVEDRIHFLGKRKDIPALIRASVVTLLPSEREGLARCVMESLCLEVPVIGADTRGVRDLVDPGCGWLTPVGNPAVLAKNMDYVLHHPAEAAAKGRNGRQKMSGYDLAHIIRLHEELYNRVLTDRDLRAGSS